MSQHRTPPSPRLVDGLHQTSPVFPSSAAISYNSSGPHQHLPREFGEDVPTHPCLSANCPSSSSGTGRLGLSSHCKNPIHAGLESLWENRQVCYRESRSHFSTLNAILFAPSPPACPFLPPSQTGGKHHVLFFGFFPTRCFICFCCYKTHRSSPGNAQQILSCTANNSHLHPRLIKEVGKGTSSKKAQIPTFNCFVLAAKHLFPRISERRKRRVDCSAPPVYQAEREVGLTEFLVPRHRITFWKRSRERPFVFKNKRDGSPFSGKLCTLQHDLRWQHYHAVM